MGLLWIDPTVEATGSATRDELDRRQRRARRGAADVLQPERRHAVHPRPRDGRGRPTTTMPTRPTTTTPTDHDDRPTSHDDGPHDRHARVRSRADSAHPPRAAGRGPARLPAAQRRADTDHHGGGDHGDRLHPRVARLERRDPARHLRLRRLRARAAPRRPPRRAQVRDRRGRHAAPARRAAARHRVRDDHPARRRTRRPAVAVEPGRRQRLLRGADHRPARHRPRPLPMGAVLRRRRSACCCRWCPVSVRTSTAPASG